MKSRNKVGDKTEPRGTPQLIRKEEEVASSIRAEMERSERKLDKSKQSEGENPKEGSLESSDACHTLSKALDMSSATTQYLSLIHISEPTRLLSNSYAVFCLKKKSQR